MLVSRVAVEDRCSEANVNNVDTTGQILSVDRK